MVIATLIERKRDGGALAPDEWRALIQAFARGEVPDYQMSALAMAVVWRGLEPPELAALTEAMLDSGDRLRWEGLAAPRVDKHSTGGVGDKISLLLAPMVAAARRRRADDVGPRRSATPAARSTSSRPSPGSAPASRCARPRRRCGASAA